MADLTSIPARRAFAGNLLEQLHGAEEEAVESSPKSRRGCCKADVRFDSCIMAGTRPFLKVFLQGFPSASTPHSTSSSSSFTSAAFPPLQILSTLHPYPHPNVPLRLGQLNSTSSFPRDRHAMSFLHYQNRCVRCWVGAARG